MRHHWHLFLLLISSLMLSSCGSNDSNTVPPEQLESRLEGPVFQTLSSEHSGVSFANMLKEDATNNYFTWEYFYNGGGVAVVDLNGDLLPDLYFTGNMTEDKLYLNQGNLTFKDITETAIKSGQDGWHTGVTYADVNQDGFIDLYVCRAGAETNPALRANLLYINNGDQTFVESASEFGLADTSHSIQSTFLDYDHDGDLDLYVMNHPGKFSEEYTGAEYDQLLASGKHSSDHLFRNDSGHFTDVSQSAGISNHAHGLGLSVSDINNDGWPDLYVANDYDEGDYLYINQKDGSFANEIDTRVKHISNFGMGTDIADFNNDGNMDMIEMDMAYADHIRSKRNMAAMSTDKFRGMVRAGKHYQYMVNTLQLNNGNHTFSEIAQMAGVAKTDWSWAPLFADFDNDGDNDLIITNGFRRDTRDRDFGNQLKASVETDGEVAFDELIDMIPETEVRNFIYSNNGDLTFTDVSEAWGFDKAFNSNGAAYADLDLDGDLDLIVNNLDAQASLYENRSNTGDQNGLTLQLTNTEKNASVLGSKVRIKTNEGEQFRELWPTRGYQSAVSTTLHFGIGIAGMLQQVEVTWPDGTFTTLLNVNASEVVKIDYAQQTDSPIKPAAPQPYFVERTADFPFSHKHNENNYDDFENELLLPHMQSRHGPFIGTGDVNNDGLADLYIGGAVGQAGSLLLHRPNGSFASSSPQTFEQGKGHEDLGSVFFDADNDNDLDLYVVSGGNAFPAGSARYTDRLYINDGQGNFVRDKGALPNLATSGMSVAVSDIDGDGDLDIFVGGRLQSQRYPTIPESHFLINDGGQFSVGTEEIAPEIKFVGMVTKSLFTDYDNDGDEDLMLAGEWMSLQFWNNDGGKFKLDAGTGLTNSNGWWFGLAEVDLDNDGDLDYVAGNLGLNHKFKASAEHPFNVYGGDFDGNGSCDIVLSKYQGDTNYPVRGRECSSQQIPEITTSFPTFKEFAEADVYKVYGKEQLEGAVHLEVKTFESAIVRNNGDGTFTLESLPTTAQRSPLNDFAIVDVNGDGFLDVIGAGNLMEAEVETVSHDAGIGVCLLNDGKGGLIPITLQRAGLFLPGNVKDLCLLQYTSQQVPVLLVTNNNSLLQVFQQLNSAQ
jgi:hypothetical protein